MHATRIRPDTRPTDLRRLAAAGLSAAIPGLGQLYNGRRRLAALFLVPSLVLLLLGFLLIQTQSPARLAAWIAAPQILGTLLTLNLLVLVWRLVAAGQAFLDPVRPGSTGRLGIIGIIVVAILVLIPHLVVYRYGTILGDTLGRVFSGDRHRDRSGCDPTGTDPRTRPTDQRPARRGRRAPEPDRGSDRHDDGRVPRPGRATPSRCCPFRATWSARRSATATSMRRS